MLCEKCCERNDWDVVYTFLCSSLSIETAKNKNAGIIVKGFSNLQEKLAYWQGYKRTLNFGEERGKDTKIILHKNNAVEVECCIEQARKWRMESVEVENLAPCEDFTGTSSKFIRKWVAESEYFALYFFFNIVIVNNEW